MPSFSSPPNFASKLLGLLTAQNQLPQAALRNATLAMSSGASKAVSQLIGKLKKSYYGGGGGEVQDNLLDAAENLWGQWLDQAEEEGDKKKRRREKKERKAEKKRQKKAAKAEGTGFGGANPLSR